MNAGSRSDDVPGTEIQSTKHVSNVCRGIRGIVPSNNLSSRFGSVSMADKGVSLARESDNLCPVQLIEIVMSDIEAKTRVSRQAFWLISQHRNGPR